MFEVKGKMNGIQIIALMAMLASCKGTETLIYVFFG